jgi:hypothetical protein
VVVGALIGLATSHAATEVCAFASVLGCGLGLLQIINLTAFAALGETIGFSQAASINALAGLSGDRSKYGMKMSFAPTPT